jgi:hydrogenase maturation factor HypE
MYWKNAEEMIKNFMKEIVESSGNQWTPQHDKNVKKIIEEVRKGIKKDAEKVLDDSVSGIFL